MVAIFHRLQVAYYPIPKVACTSIKELLYALETGLDPADLKARDGGPLNIHQVYGSTPDGGRWNTVTRAYWSFAVVRDPVERFVSGYRNRIRHHGDLQREASRKLRWLGLSDRPDFDDFVRRFVAYLRLSKAVNHHFRPQKDYVGRVLSRVDRVYWMEELDLLTKDLERRVGQPVAMPRQQTGGAEVRVELEAWHRRWICEYMRRDYAMLARIGYGKGPGRAGANGLAPRVLRRLGGM